MFAKGKISGTGQSLLFFACAFLSSTAAFAEKETEWKLVQKEKSLGDQTIYFCPKAVRIDNRSGGYSLVSKAPDWDVLLFREDDKTCCRLTRNQYFAKQAFVVKHGHSLGTVLKTYTFGPVKAPLYYGPYHNDVIKRFNGIPTQVEDVISSYYKSNSVDGIVLRSQSNSMSRAKTDSSVFMPIDMNPTGLLRETLSLETIPYKEADFKVPPNLRQIADTKQILTGKQQRKDAESIFLDMGIGDELGKPKGK